LRKKQIGTITFFTALVTYLALYFQWTEFYKGYSYSSFNLSVSIIFLLEWMLFSFYWGKIQEEKYQKFIIIYWGIDIIVSTLIWIFANDTFMKAFLFPFYIWYWGPMYGVKYIFFDGGMFNVDVSLLILITSPLGILFSFIGYRFGYFVSKAKKS
jgi:hypothetical protein